MSKTLLKSNIITLRIQINYICSIMAKEIVYKNNSTVDNTKYASSKAFRKPDSRVTLKTRQLLREAGYHVQQLTNNTHRRLKYRGRPKGKEVTMPIQISLDYSSLQYIGIVRHYIQKKHDITLSQLELLLFLYPLGIWSKDDYDLFPHRFSTRTIKPIMEKGFIDDIFEHELEPESDKKVYRLTQKAKMIVRDFYQYLHQEKLIPETAVSNPLFRYDANPRDLRKAKAIARINELLSGKKTKEHEKLNKRIRKQLSSEETEEKRKKHLHISKEVQRERKLNKIKSELKRKEY